MVPVGPAGWLHRTPIPTVNYDAGEQVGWPRFAATIAGVARAEPHAVVLTGNYGEAGAVDRYAPDLAPAYSGHNSYWSWGPPPEQATAAIVVGLPEAQLRRWFGTVRAAAEIDDGVGLDNEEQCMPVWVASDRLVPWSVIWPQLRRLG